MEHRKIACVIYVIATQNELPQVKESLKSQEFDTGCVLTTLEVAQAAQEGTAGGLPTPVRDCIANSQLCIFLLPANKEDDGGIGQAAQLAVQLEKRIIGVVAGDRDQYPDGFKAVASVIRVSSSALASAIQGKNIWESPNKSAIPERSIDHQKCQ